MSKLVHVFYLCIVATLGGVIAWLALERSTESNRHSHRGYNVTSIAVIPFLGVESETSPNHLAETITSKLSGSLRKNRHIQVTPTADTEAIRVATGDAQALGEKLGVSTILKGTVWHTQGIIRVTVELIDVKSNVHFWSSTYDRKLGDLDLILSDIERNVLSFVDK